MAMYNARENSTNVYIYLLWSSSDCPYIFLFYLLYKVRDINHDDYDNYNN